VSSWSVAPGPYRLDDYVNGSLQSLQHTWIALCVAAAHTDHFDDYVINSVAASVHYVNGINNYFIIVKATTEAARIPFVRAYMSLLGYGQVRFHKDNLRHLFRFPDSFDTLRIHSTIHGPYGHEIALITT
jgi:hypothetical protein